MYERFIAAVEETVSETLDTVPKDKKEHHLAKTLQKQGGR
jgi:hypothetical protein